MNTIPGTSVPLNVYEPTGKRPILRNDSEARQRRGLLAMVHIAKQQMGLNSGEYEMILRGFKVASSAELTILQLERLVKYLKKLGWKPVKRRIKSPLRPPLQRGDGGDINPCRLDALRRRCVEVAWEIENGQKRLAGLAEKICGVASLTWCHDAKKLERLLAVLGKIKLTESATKPDNWIPASAGMTDETNGGSHEKN